jgi:spore coat protein U-like protein
VFGAYDVFSPTPRDSTAVLSVFCDEHSNVTIQLSRGSSPTFVPRTLLKGAATLNYNLFRDAAYSTIWGDGTGGTSDLTVRINRNHTSTFPVYGRLPAGQDASAGTYADTIIVSVIY